MYIETTSNIHGHGRLFVSFEGIDIIQISKITFLYIRFSILTIDSKKLLLEDKTWSTQYTIPKNDRYSNTTTEWTILSLTFTVENYGINLVYDQIDTLHGDMCFSNITITHSVY